jgi:hypothetical protein
MIPFVANDPTFAASAGAEYSLIGFREAGMLVACVGAHFSGDTAELLQPCHRHGFRQTHARFPRGRPPVGPSHQAPARRPGAFSSRLGCS